MMNEEYLIFYSLRVTHYSLRIYHSPLTITPSRFLFIKNLIKFSAILIGALFNQIFATVDVNMKIFIQL